MIIRMFHSMSSGRHDDRVWPPAGVDFEVPDWEGEDLVNGGNAVKVADSPRGAERAPEPVPVPEPEPVTEPEPETEPDVEAEVPAGEPPRPTASKQDWIDYVVGRGSDPVDAMNRTKQQLMEKYGQRP